MSLTKICVHSSATVDDEALSNRACTAKTRASETDDEALSRNRACTAKTRASETDDEALCRKQAAKTRAQKQTMKPCVEKNAIGHVLPKREPRG